MAIGDEEKSGLQSLEALISEGVVEIRKSVGDIEAEKLVKNTEGRRMDEARRERATELRSQGVKTDTSGTSLDDKAALGMGAYLLPIALAAISPNESYNDLRMRFLSDGSLTVVGRKLGALGDQETYEAATNEMQKNEASTTSLRYIVRTARLDWDKRQGEKITFHLPSEALPGELVFTTNLEGPEGNRAVTWSLDWSFPNLQSLG